MGNKRKHFGCSKQKQKKSMENARKIMLVKKSKMGNKYNKTKKKSLLQRKRQKLLNLKNVIALRERRRKEQEALAAEQNGDNGEGMAVEPGMEKPKQKQRPYKPEPVQILGDLNEKTLRARPEPKPMPMKRIYKKRVRPPCTDIVKTENVPQSIDGAQGETNENGDSLLIVMASGPPQPVPEVRPGADGIPAKRRYQRKKRAPKKQSENNRESKPKAWYYASPRVYDGRKMIAKVYNFLERELGFLKELLGPNCDISPLANLVARTAEATGVTEGTVKKLVAEDQQQKAIQRARRLEREKHSRLERQQKSKSDCVKRTKKQPAPQLEPNNPNSEEFSPLNTVNVVQVQIIDEMSELDSAVASIGGQPLDFTLHNQHSDIAQLQYGAPALDNQRLEIAQLHYGNPDLDQKTVQLHYLSPAVDAQLPDTQFNQIKVLEVTPLEMDPLQIKLEVDLSPTAVQEHNKIPTADTQECMDIDIPPEVKTEPAEPWDESQPAPLAPLTPVTPASTTALQPPPVTLTEVGSTLIVTYTDN